MPSNPHSSEIPEEARTLAEPDALAELRDDPVLANVRTFESFPIIGSCVLFARLGGGAQGAVYRAWHRELNIQVAVKVRVAGSGIAADRFVLEAGQGAGLTHQNLIGALEVKEADGLQYMILDYVDGEDVAARMRRKRRMEPREALTILREAAVGLAFAHKKGVLHRDIKPANIMISKDGEVKIADLGLAKAAGVTDVSLTMAGSGMGTPMFMPPEQFVEAKSVGPAADVYSLAITGWLMLSGRNPFKGSSPYEIKDHVCDTGVANLQNIVPGIAPSIADLLARGTERKASKRIPDGAHFLTEVERELYALGGPVDLTDPQAGASLHMGVLPPSADVITRLAKHESIVRGGARKEHATIPSGPRNEAPIVAPRDAAGQKKKSAMPTVAMLLLLAAGGGGAGWWFTMGPGAKPQPGNAPTEPAPHQDKQEAPGNESGRESAEEPGDDPSGAPGTTTSPGPTAQDPGPGPSKPAADATVQPKTPPVNEHKALARAAYIQSDWSTMFVEMRLAAEASTMGQSELHQWLDTLTKAFRKFDSWEQTRDRLDPEGRKAVVALAENPTSSTALLCLTAAEIYVYYDGLRYRIMESPVDYEALLRNCALGPVPVITKADFLLGAAALDQFFLQSKDGGIPDKRTTDSAWSQLKLAADAGHESAGAWMGVLYLHIKGIEGRPNANANVPRSQVIDQATLVETVKESARKGSKEAHYVLATMYNLGMAPVAGSGDTGDRERQDLSNKHYKSAARLGHPVAIDVLMERGVNIGSAVNDNLEMLESFKNQPNPETRALVERILAVAVLTEQPGGKLAGYPRGEALEVLYQRSLEPIAPDAQDRAWLDRALWLLWSEGQVELPADVQARWFQEACASPWGAQFRPLTMNLLLGRGQGFGEAALDIANSGAVFDRKFPSAKVLQRTIAEVVLAPEAVYPPIVQRLLPRR